MAPVIGKTRETNGLPMCFPLVTRRRQWSCCVISIQPWINESKSKEWFRVLTCFNPTSPWHFFIASPLVRLRWWRLNWPLWISIAVAPCHGWESNTDDAVAWTILQVPLGVISLISWSTRIGTHVVSFNEKPPFCNLPQDWYWYHSAEVPHFRISFLHRCISCIGVSIFKNVGIACGGISDEFVPAMEVCSPPFTRAPSPKMGRAAAVKGGILLRTAACS